MKPSLVFVCFILFCFDKYVIYCNENTLNMNEIDHDFDLKEGLVKFEIEGDTSHLFAAEDFEKKEAVLLSEDASVKIEANQTISTNSTLPKKKNTSANSHPDCLNSDLLIQRDNNTVQLVNGSHLTHLLSDSETNKCFLVLFYVPWCPFSTRLAHIYNALPRAFSNLDILAFDVSKSIGYNTKFGTSAVPMIILFQQKNVVVKFNYTNKNLTDYIEFISKNSGFDANKSITIIETDLEGPVPTVPIKKFDYYLFISWIFLIFTTFDYLIRKTKVKLYLIGLAKRIITFLRPERLLELPQPPVIPMIQHHHLHND